MIKSVFVLGSTSKVAEAICLELANKGCIEFHLVSRNQEKNFHIKSRLAKYNVLITEEYNDLMQNTFFDKPFIPEIKKYDLYLIVSGYLGSNKEAQVNIKESLKIINSNYVGLIPWLNSILTSNRISEPGKLWVFSSVASDIGRPSNYFYGAAKSALTTHCEGLLAKCFNKPFQIRIIKAGFIKTPMSEGKAPEILCISPKKLAKILLMNPNKRGVEYLPSWWFLVMQFVKRLPKFILSKM